MKKIVLFFLSFMTVFGGEIKIAVASNVSYALDELIFTFNKNYPNIKVQPIISGSGNLTAQIRNQAPFSLFLSANMKYPKKLFELGLAITKPAVYAKGGISLVTRKDINLSKGIGILTQAHIKSIAIANPDIAPYGMASVQALKEVKLYKKVKKKLIYGQNISQTLTYALKATDIGFVANSALFSPKLNHVKFSYKNIDKSLYQPIKQGVVLLNFAKKNEEARAFYDFILSKEAKGIFKKYGYSVDE